MSWRVAVNCNNEKKKNREETFFKLPSDNKLQRAWVKAINCTSLPTHSCQVMLRPL